MHGLGTPIPLFSGCANANSYFDRRGFSEIDIGDPDGAVDRIEQILASNLWQDNREFIRENRGRLMTEHNLFAVIAAIIGRGGEESRSLRGLTASATIKPSHQIGFRNQMRGALKRSLRSASRIIPFPADRLGKSGDSGSKR